MSLLHRVATAVAGAVLAATFLATPSAALGATSTTGNPTAGQFCADNEHTKFKLNKATGVWHQCVDNNGWRWKKIDGAPTGGTCIVNGYSQPCVTPSKSTSPTPKASTSTTTGEPELPVTSSIDGTYMSGLVVGGVILVLLGAGLFYWVPRRRGAHRV